MRFLSFCNDKEDAEKEAKLKEAALRIEEAIKKDKALDELVEYVPQPEDTIDLSNDTRPLYERLLEQKNKKQEAFEESHKLSNLVTKLDEDDASYLNEVARNKQEEELKKRLEVYDALEEKKRMKEKRDLDDEKKLKESLIGSKMVSNKSSPLKTKLSFIKVKPKAKQTGESYEHATSDFVSDQPSDSDRQTRSSAKRARQSDDGPNNSKTSSDSKNAEVSKHQKRDEGKEGSDDRDRKEKETNSQKEDVNCSCRTIDVMKCIGVLPSLPIIRAIHDSDSEDSDDGYVRIVPKIAHHGHK